MLTLETNLRAVRYFLRQSRDLIVWQRFELSPPVRVHPFRSHIIIYTQENNGDIFIVRVRHSREDWVNR
ncbi:type II toxin-antitoxin system RelE/ParE family toxin [Aequoribacter sp.]|uniref:type II toxin-antitoxin system RelE/ParE family toxin n=1 Tax=Aequoribacter sp. TaxID=2847771 RepID=UPI003F69B59F